jgi:alkylated DNA repair dioxygenase AlkB
MLAQQISLFGREAIAVDGSFARLRRIDLDGTAWVDQVPAWVEGHQRLMDELVRTTRWQTERRLVYDRMVDVPRLLASFPEDGPGHPVLEEMRRLLSQRYASPFPHLSAALYRDGRDSVACHGDLVARELPEALVVTVSLGEPRRFVLKPREGAARSRALRLGWGDLTVMGGACQRTWLHGIPKVAQAGPRLVLMFRPTWYAAAARPNGA